MILGFEDRPSDSPLIERVWRSRSDQGGPFVSIAESRFEMCVTRRQGETCITLRGPETKASLAQCPPDGEWLGIRFTVGTFMPGLTPGEVRDRRDAMLPGASSRAFWLQGSAWEYPDFDNADTFVARLVRRGLVVRDPIVDDVIRRQVRPHALRSAQRHFRRATGLSHREVAQIERARHAVALLRQGLPILDVVHAAGYYDQADLTRALRLRAGQTPGELRRHSAQLSFLYKTAPLSASTMRAEALA